LEREIDLWLIFLNNLFVNFQIKYPITAPSVFIIKSSISVFLRLNNWQSSMDNEKPKPIIKIFRGFLYRFQIKGIKKPRGKNIIIFKT